MEGTIVNLDDLFPQFFQLFFETSVSKDVVRIIYSYFLVGEIGKLCSDKLMKKTCNFLQQLEQDLEVDIHTVNKVLQQSGAVISGSYVLCHLDEESWSARDVDIYIMDDPCDNKMQSIVDVLLMQQNFRYGNGDEFKNESIKIIVENLLPDLKHDEKITIFSEHNGEIRSEMNQENGYHGAMTNLDQYYNEDITKFPNNIFITRFRPDYPRVLGIIAQKKYHLKNINIDLIYINSTRFSSPRQFISESFDFDFLKNVWDGKRLEIINYASLISRKSKYCPPRFLSNVGRDDLVNYNSEFTLLGELVEARKLKYQSRGYFVGEGDAIAPPTPPL
jgi:hypothetical protein